jgi:hypothetical protein
MHTELIRLDALSKCCYCGEHADANTKSSIATFYPNDAGEECAEVLAVCNYCLPNVTPRKQQLPEIRGLVIPASEAERLKVITTCRHIAIEEFAKTAGYPLVCKPLLLDKPTHKAILFTKDKTYSALFSWQDGDPWIIGGKLAKDALAIYRSIEGCKTEATWMFGNPIITSSDESLLQELAKDGDL